MGFLNRTYRLFTTLLYTYLLCTPVATGNLIVFGLANHVPPGSYVVCPLHDCSHLSQVPITSSILRILGIPSGLLPSRVPLNPILYNRI